MKKGKNAGPCKTVHQYWTAILAIIVGLLLVTSFSSAIGKQGKADITSGTCPVLTFKLTDNKTYYTVGDMVNYSYICADGTNTSSVSIQLVKPDSTTTVYNTGTNVGSVLQQMGFSTSNLTPGSYTLKAVLGTGTSYPVYFSVASAGTTTTTTSNPTYMGPTLMGTIFKDGQYVEQDTFALRSCVSPNAWMNEGTTYSGARSFHCMSNYTQTSNDIPPTPCNGILWSGYSSGSSTTATGSDYCATTKNSTTTTTTTTPTTTTSCPSGWYWSGSSCVQSSTTTTTTTTTPTPTTTTPTTTSGACAIGEKCASSSWCQNGQQFYYPTGELTCVAWSSDGTTPQAPAGTSACKPSDTNCVAPGQTVPYSSGKWCASGMSFYSTTQMTCVANGSPAPAGYSSCRPGDSQCIPSGSYGPSSGYCSNGMQFYQKVKDSNPNNDKYCAEMKYMTPGTAATMMNNQPEPPAGYGSCEPTNTSCKEKGDKWTDNNTSNYCSNGQKCNLSPTGGMCVGWNDSCPSGTKYCSATDTNCIEPGEYKTLPASTSNGTGSLWCGGGGGMTFYSSTQAYCAPSAKIGTMNMWTSADVKAIIAKLGTGWGVCPPKGYSSTSYTSSRCIEPGQTGSSSDWCGWWPPNSSGNSYNANSTTRICPGYDDGTPVPPTPTPIPLPVIPPIKEICPLMPTVSSCPAGQTMIKVPGTGTCGGYAYCKADDKTQPPICPAVSPVYCPSGNYIQGVYESGCTYTRCSDIKVPPVPKYDICRPIRDQSRTYKKEITKINNNLKYLPKDSIIYGTVKALLKSAQDNYNAIQKAFPLGKKVVCTDDLYNTLQGQMTSLKTVTINMKNKAANLDYYVKCIKFQRALDQRIRSLVAYNDSLIKTNSSISLLDDIAAYKDLRSQTTDALCSEADANDIKELNYQRQDIEESISETMSSGN